MPARRASSAPDDLRRPLAVSAAVHALLLFLLIVAFPQEQRGEPWGGAGGGAIEVNVVRNLPGVPLPRPPAVTQNRRATRGPGLHRAEPDEPAAAPEQATEIPSFDRQPRRAPAREPQPPRRPPLGGVPSESGGGPAALPYTSFQLGPAEAALTLGAGGSFGNRYPWYVESVRRRISSNWLLSTIDPYVRWAPRSTLSFEILRDGTVVNIQVMQSSGVPSVDRSAVRAVRESSPLEPLPSDYRGDKVLVEFWFDFRREE